MLKSLRSRVVVMVLVAIGVLFVPLAWLSYAFMMEEVDELFDARLSENAKTLIAFQAAVPAAENSASATVPSWSPKDELHRLVVRGHPYEEQIGFQVWDANNRLATTSSNFSDLTIDAAPAGFADINVAKRRWRVFTFLSDDHRWVRVGERYDSRREIGRALALEATIPIVLAFPLLALLVGAAVHRGMQPLRRLAEQLSTRKSDDTQPIGGNYTTEELYPVVWSLNGLLRRLQQTLDDERTFTTNAAHELRTPLAGAIVHLENAQSLDDVTAIRQALVDARSGLDRLSHLVNQLLDLARWDSGQAHPMSPVDVNECIEQELAEMGHELTTKDIEVIWTPAAGLPTVLGWQPGIRSVARNLLDNAIRYSDDGGKLTLATALRDNQVIFSIDDQGPGIPASQRTALFKRFQRGETNAPGSGIGLSLVARILDVHRATIVLGDGAGGRGLRVEIRFPLGTEKSAG